MVTGGKLIISTLSVVNNGALVEMLSSMLTTNTSHDTSHDCAASGLTTSGTF